MGYAEVHKLHPLNFEEFLMACKVPLQIIDKVKVCLKKYEPIPNSYYLAISNLFNTYLLIGGMPEVVEHYLTTKDYVSTFKIQDTIKNTYLEDFSKYESNPKKGLLSKIYTNIPIQLNKEYNRFFLNDIKEDMRYSQVELSLVGLVESGYIHKVNQVSTLSNGLRQTVKESFKLYLNDVGLLTSMNEEILRYNLISKNKETNYKAIYENFVCQEIAQKYDDIFYFKSGKHSNIEFIYLDKGINSIVPIEVKSGKDFQKHKSIDYLLETYPDIKKAFVLTSTNIIVDGKITYLPIWSIGMLKTFDLKEMIEEYEKNNKNTSIEDLLK